VRGQGEKKEATSSPDSRDRDRIDRTRSIQPSHSAAPSPFSSPVPFNFTPFGLSACINRLW